MSEKDDEMNTYQRITGKRTGSQKLTNEEVLEICWRLEQGESLRSIASDYPVSRATVRHISTGKTWGDLTGRGD